jgi:hypothetical protein
MSHNKKEFAMHLRTTLFALLFVSTLAQAQDSYENLQSIRYLAFSAASHLLLHYNPVTGAADPQHGEKYRSELQQMSTTLASIPSTELQEDSKRLRELVSDLEQRPSSDAPLYPIWINSILESQAKLDGQLQTAGQTLTAPNAAIAELDNLNLSIQRLLLYYQTRAFGSLAVYIDELKDGAPNNLDQSILQSFEKLKMALPDSTKKLAKMKRKYDYIRSHLLQQEAQ